MDELQVTYNYHLQCLADFVDAQMNYYNNCSKILQDLCKQIGNTTGMPNKTIAAANNNTMASNDILVSIDPTDEFGANAIGVGLSMNLNLNTKKAKVLFDYEATDPKEVIIILLFVINKFINLF